MKIQSPPLKKVSFSGYKSFKNMQEMNIKPLTIIFGYNNSGKSAAVRLIPMLAASFSIKKPETHLKSYIDYTAPCLRGAIFRDIAHANQSRMEFILEWDDGEKFGFELKQDGVDPEKITKLLYKEVSDSSFIEKIYIEAIASGPIYEEENNPEQKLTVENFQTTATLNDIPAHQSITNKLVNLSTSVHWLNSIRCHPPREFFIDPTVKTGINYDGSGTAETIWSLAQSRSASFDAINSWLDQTCGRKIDPGMFSQSAINNRVSVRLETISTSEKPTTTPIRIPIIDSGEGIAQALPVVTLCAQAANGELGENPIIFLEQPELHLHPKAVVALADFLVSCIQRNRKARFVIETHSESFLLAMQTALAGKTIQLEEICTYWVSKGDSNEGSNLDNVEFDEEAYILSNFPEEVFQEVYEQAKKLVDTREGGKK